MNHILALLPPILTLILALWSKNVIIALFVGVLSCSLIANGTGFLYAFVNEYMVGGITGNLDVFIMLFIFGMMIEAIKKAGGFNAFTRIAGSRIRSDRSAMFFTWLIALFCSDGTMSTIGVGTIMRPLTDKHKVSHEKLGTILSCTGPAMCAMLPWTIYMLAISGMIQAVDPSLDGMAEYLRLIPFNFYAIGSVLLGLLVALKVIPDFGHMKKCQQKFAEKEATRMKAAQSTKAKEAKDGDKAKENSDMLSFVLPFVVSIVLVVYYYFTTGMVTITVPFFAGLLVICVYGLVRRYFKLDQLIGVLVEGMMSMVPIILLLTLAFAFGKGVTAVGFSETIVELTGGLLTAKMLPFIVCFFCGLCAFATGSLLSGMAVFLPIAIPLVAALGANLPIVLAACLGGGMFGDETSPLSDMVIQAATGADVDVMSLAKAQIPLKTAVFLIACLIYLVIGLVML